MGKIKLKQFLCSALIAAAIVLTSIIPAFAYTVVKEGQTLTALHIGRADGRFLEVSSKDFGSA